MASVASIVAAANRQVRPFPRVPAIRSNFCGMKDGSGTVMFDPYLLSLWLYGDWARLNEWFTLKRAAGLTHVVVCPVAQYPTIDLPRADVRTTPGFFADFLTRVIDEGFCPFVMLTSGDGGTGAPGADMDLYWPGLFAALKPFAKSLIACPGFEVVGPGGGWTSAQLSRGLQLIHANLPEAVLAVHLQDERASGASNPVEPDDPWQGDEPGFWYSHGGEFVDLLAYQTPSGRKLLDGDEWVDRWQEIVERTGIGGRGWRKADLCFFETIAEDFAHDRCGPEAALPLREKAQAICQAFGISCTWGNG